MKTSKILAMVLCLSLFAVSVFAETAEADGLKLTLTTDKAEYAADEQHIKEKPVSLNCDTGCYYVILTASGTALA